MDVSIFGRLTKECHTVSLIIPKQHCKALAFQLSESNETEYQRKVNHERILHQGRLEMLRILLRRFLNNPKCREMVNYKSILVINDKAIEDYLDSELVNFDYDLEVAIKCYQAYTPAPQPFDAKCKCGYVPPFCNCYKY